MGYLEELMKKKPQISNEGSLTASKNNTSSSKYAELLSLYGNETRARNTRENLISGKGNPKDALEKLTGYKYIPSAVIKKPQVSVPETNKVAFEKPKGLLGAYVGLMDKISDSKLMNTIGQGVSQAMTPVGQDSPIEYNKNNMIGTDTALGKAANWGLNQAGRMSGAVLMGQGLNGLNTLNAFDDIASDAVRRGLAKSGIQGKAIPILQRGLTGALEGSASNAYEDYMAGKDAKEIASSALQGGLFGGAVGSAIGGVNVARDGLQLPQIGSNDFRAETEYKIDNQPKARTKGAYTVKNTTLDNVQREYDEAVRQIQDYWGHWQLDEAEIRLGAEELGIDLDNILNRMEQAEANGYDLRGNAERARVGQVAGVGAEARPIEPLNKQTYTLPTIENLKNFKPKEAPAPEVLFDNSWEAVQARSRLPEHLKKNIENPNIPEVYKNNLEAEVRGTDINAKNEAAFEIVNDSFNLDLAKGTEFEGMSVRQLNSLNAKLDREFNDYMNRDMEDKAEELLPKMKAVKEILGIENINDDIAKWKDKSMISYQRETFDRNLEDMIGKEESQKYINTYSQPLKEAEANRTRYLNEAREKVKAFGIKAGSKESELVQKFGEGEISLAKLQGLTKDWRNVVQTADYLRKYYDETLDAINEVLERNGYRPVAKRPNYFPHMGELEGILEKMGFKNDTLPTEISGRTANFKPGKNFFANALQRKGDKTVYDAIRGFDNYAEAASKQIFLTDSIQRLRGLENEIRTIAKDSSHLSNFVSYLNQYTNYIAGKKHDLDRSGESTIGRVVYKISDLIKKQVGSNMVGMNVSSNLTNFIPLTQSIATTSKSAAAKGLAETIGDLLSHNDDFINKSDFLTRRMGSNRLAMSNWEKVGKKMSGIFEGIDRFTSSFIVRSKYNELISQGLSEAAAMRGADNYAARLMTDKSLGQLPTIFNSKSIGMLTQFQSEVNNQVSFLLKDLKGLQKTGEIKTGLGSAIVQMSLYSWLFNSVFEQLAGRRPAMDPIQAVMDATDDEKPIDARIGDFTNAILDQLPGTSIITGGRIPIKAPLEGAGDVGKGLFELASGKGEKTLVKGATKTLPYLLPTGGNQIQKTLKGISALGDSGVYNSDFNYNKDQLRYAIDPNTANKLRGILFGVSAFPETQEYYDKNRRALSTKQTEEYNSHISRGLTPKEAYDIIIKAREERAKK